MTFLTTSLAIMIMKMTIMIKCDDKLCLLPPCYHYFNHPAIMKMMILESNFDEEGDHDDDISEESHI